MVGMQEIVPEFKLYRGQNMLEEKGLRFHKVSLSNRGKYVTSFFIDGVRVTMRCGYNTRNKMRWIILLDDIGGIILPQTFIKQGKRCELGFLANQQDLHYYVTLSPKNPYKTFLSNYDYLFWQLDFTLCFVGYAQEIEVEYETLNREHLVGN